MKHFSTYRTAEQESSISRQLGTWSSYHKVDWNHLDKTVELLWTEILSHWDMQNLPSASRYNLGLELNQKQQHFEEGLFYCL